MYMRSQPGMVFPALCGMNEMTHMEIEMGALCVISDTLYSCNWNCLKIGIFLLVVLQANGVPRNFVWGEGLNKFS